MKQNIKNWLNIAIFSFLLLATGIITACSNDDDENADTNLPSTQYENVAGKYISCLSDVVNS